MVDFALLRKNMVFGQLLPNRINHPLLLRAFETVPREIFCPKNKVSMAYTDHMIPLTGGRHMLAPLALAKLIAILDIKPNDKVLDVGCGMGYSSAIINFLSSSVIGIEQDAHLFEKEREHLYDLGYHIELHQSTLDQGWPKGAPYDIIIIQGAMKSVPAGLVSQLKDGGKMALFLKSSDDDLARGTLVQKSRKSLTQTTRFEHDAPFIHLAHSINHNPWSDFYAV